MKDLPLLAILKIITTSCNFRQKKKKHPTNKRKKTAEAKQNQIVEILLNYINQKCKLFTNVCAIVYILIYLANLAKLLPYECIYFVLNLNMSCKRIQTNCHHLFQFFFTQNASLKYNTLYCTTQMVDVFFGALVELKLQFVLVISLSQALE